MKKIFYLASIAALALSSCAKDETTQAAIEDVKGGSKIVAAMEADDTRTQLATSNDVDFEYRWSLGDQLGIYGYGENTLSNAAFVLDNASDNSPVGVFTSQHVLNANKSYMAVYPRFAEPLFDVASDKAPEDIAATPAPNNENYGPRVTDGKSVTMKILPVQKYQDKSFYTTTAPAISGSFEVNAQGEAAINMQPVADYLMVNVRSTEQIETLTLALLDRKAGKKWLAISGESNLASYWFNGENGWEYRYFIPEGNATDVAHATMPVDDAQAQYEATRLDKYTITIKTDEAFRTVACHDPNTYVFTIPAGILGMDGNVDAYVWVNEVPEITLAEDPNLSATIQSSHFWSSATLNVANLNMADFEVQGTDTNAQMNYALAANGVTKISRMDANKSNENKVVRQLENTVFWMNAKDNKGNRKSFLYNPNDDAIIEDEAQLLEYFSDYDKSSNKKVYHNDAFLCAGATFDFSEANMLKRAAEYEDTPYEVYIANYLADGFPCIAEYNNNFVGNGAQIINIFKPLQSKKGLFGGNDDWNYPHHVVALATRAGENVAPTQKTISNVTFSNIVAKTIEGDKKYDANDKPYRVDQLGYILAASFGGKIKDVTVSNSYGEAVMGEGSATQLAGLTVKDADKLCNVFDALYLNNHIDLTNTWADLSTVNGEVFEYIVPAAYEGAVASATATEDGDLNVITIANGNANTYDKLTYEVLYHEDITDVAAVVIGGVSYWTGGKWNVENTARNQVKKNDGTVIGRYIQYAEELAAGYTTTGMKAVLARNIDLNWGNLQWYKPNGSINYYYDWNMVNFNELDGAGKSISNVMMVVYDYNVRSLSAETKVAPFDAATVKNLTMNNVAIDIWTPTTDDTITVPEFIGGVALGATTVNNVALNNLSIETYRSDNSANQEGNYKIGQNSKIGWVVASANGTVKFEGVTVNGVESNVKGISGVVGQVTVSNAAGSAQFVRVASTNVDDTVNSAISKFAKYNSSTIVMAEGTVVGLVNNNKAAGLDLNVEFKQSGKPLFYYSIDNTGCDINVNYDEAEYKTLSK